VFGKHALRIKKKHFFFDKNRTWQTLIENGLSLATWLGLLGPKAQANKHELKSETQ
jgi:hypothetical protein